MRIAVLANGSQGDVRPFVAVGAGLAGRGHAVRVITDPGFAPMVETAGLAHVPLRGDFRAMLLERHGISALTGNPLRLMRLIRRIGRELAPIWADDTMAACRDVDALVVGNASALLAVPIAERLGVPMVQGWLQPMAPTGAFTSPLLPPLPLAGAAARCTHLAIRHLLWWGLRESAELTNKRVGAPPPRGGRAAWAASDRLPTFCAVSPALVPPPPDWPRTVRMTGFLFLDPPGEPDPALHGFVEAGDPPVYIGFGSMLSGDPVGAAEAVVGTLRRAGRRAVIATGWGALDRAVLEAARGRGLPLCIAENVPHAWLLPRAAVAVHHGGAGTTAAVLRAGVPSVVVPFLADQFFWGARAQAAGVAPAPIPMRRMTEARLAPALERALADAGMRRQAATLGAAVRREDGVAAAADVIEQGIADGLTPRPRA